MGRNEAETMDLVKGRNELDVSDSIKMFDSRIRIYDGPSGQKGS
mgnify:CR=1 FL=1